MNCKVVSWLSLLLSATFLFAATTAQAENLNVAVASNFANALRVLSQVFERSSGHQLRISSASTGKLYMQIQHGAPFDVFLAADEKRPDMLLAEGRADQDSAFVYAAGKLIFVSNIKIDGECKDMLKSTALKRLSIANPVTAPYGFAARQVMEELGVWTMLEPRMVMGGNVAQAMQFVSTENAQAGFVARSMLDRAGVTGGGIWDVPADMYSPIKQKMVLLNRAKNKASALAFVRFMHSAEARGIIEAAGYGVLD